jgi:zinc/manganese transport system permease protein
MAEAFSLMMWPLLACFVLVGIHAYLGVHVIARKVIFVDLALAQLAALGAVYATYAGLSLDAEPALVKLVSIAFTFFGAVLFSFTPKNVDIVPREAFIGIIYAGALSLTILLTSSLSHGAEEVQQLLAGNILWASPEEVISTAILYIVIGLIHFLFRKPFFALSYELANEATLNRSQRLWDFLFYATFGIVVTSSVSIGGVLLVFGYLIIPSVMSVMLANTTRMRLLLAWGSGLLISTLGIVVSYFFDLPTGPTIVVLMGLLLVLVAIVMNLLRGMQKRAFCQILLLMAALMTFALPTFILKLGGEHVRENHHN